MKKIFSVELNFLVGILIIVGIVVANGIIAYGTMTDILSSVNEAGKPDAKLMLLKDISSELADAEGNVKAFIATRDSSYFHAILAEEQTIDMKLTLLNKYNESKNTALSEKNNTDTIFTLANNKFSILSELIILKDNDDVLKARNNELVQKDKNINKQLRVLISRMETSERDLTAKNMVEADKKSGKAKTMIAIFCIVSSIFLLFVAFVIIRYIRTNRAYSEALKKARAEAEDLVRAKEDFLANMSHEMRTPLHAIIGFTEQIMQEPMEKEQAKQLEIVKKSANHLMHVINDVLDFTKIESGKIEFEKTEFKPIVIIEDVIKLLNVLLEDKKEVDISYTIDKDTPEVLVGDPIRLKQILFNLIGNSIKFTTRGHITIKMSSVIKYNKKDTLLNIEVSDTGIGIAKEKLGSIFNAFEQADTSTTRRYGGTGLGLTITEKLIKLQNGTIGIESEEGKGTTVTITIPYLIGSSGDLPKQSEKVFKNGKLNTGIILIADDEKYNRMLLGAILKKWNIDYVEAENGKEVLDLLEENDYSMILMDALMPIMSGVEATLSIRKSRNEKIAQIPIIGISATTSQEDIKKFLDSGMNDFLTKPFKESELHHIIESVLNLNTVTKKVSKAKPKEAKNTTKESKKTVKKEVPKYNLDELYRVGNGEEGFVDEMIEIFIKTTKVGLKNINEFAEGKAWDKVSEEAHKISSPCIHLGANDLYSLIKKIEEQSKKGIKTDELPDLINQAEEEANEIISLLEKELDKKQSKVSI